MDIGPRVKTEVCPILSGRYIATQPRLQVLMYASYICYIDSEGKLEVGTWKNRENHLCHESTYDFQDVPGVGMESDWGYCRCKLRHHEVATIVVLDPRWKVDRKISEFFLNIISKEIIISISSVGIGIVHHITPCRGEIRLCLVGMYNLSISIRELIVSKNKVTIMI